jgi:hypothetical protein
MSTIIRWIFCCATPSSPLPFWTKQSIGSAARVNQGNQEDSDLSEYNSFILLGFILHMALIGWSVPTLVSDWSVATCAGPASKDPASEDGEPRDASYTIHVWIILCLAFLLYSPWRAINFHRSMREKKLGDAMIQVTWLVFSLTALGLTAWGVAEVFFSCEDFEKSMLFGPSVATLLLMSLDSVGGLVTLAVVT